MTRPNMAILLLLCILGGGFAVEVDQQAPLYEHSGDHLCQLPQCSCRESLPGLLHIHCNCHHDQVLILGMKNRNSDATQLPSNCVHLDLENCKRVELHTHLINNMSNLYNLTIKNVDSVIIQPNLYESNSKTKNLSTVDISHVENLEVKRFAFKDLMINNRFYLNEVRMKSVVSMAFAFEYVKEFSVFASHFHRISMFGIKLSRCQEFNVLGMTNFGSLAAHAIKVRCDKFSLAYNWFARLQDSSFEVEYGLCDIQGNTFVSLTGKSFFGLQPLPKGLQKGSRDMAMSGLVFRENKFSAEPLLPFGSLAMPAFGLLSEESSYIDIEGNQFPCRCQSIGWLLAFGEFGLNSQSLLEVGSNKGGGTVPFLSLLYSTAGPCITCKNSKCSDVEGGQGLSEYSISVLHRGEDGAVFCGKQGLQVTDYDMGGGAVTDLGGLQPQKWKEVDQAVSDDGEGVEDKEKGGDDKQDKSESKREHTTPPKSLHGFSSRGNSHTPWICLSPVLLLVELQNTVIFNIMNRMI